MKLNEKIKILKSEDDLKFIRKLKFNNIDELIDTDGLKGKIGNIIIDLLVGINRCDDYLDWIDALDKLHKVYIFEEFEETSFKKYLKEINDDFPNVVKFHNEYYIDGNGRHRLTIAKCLVIKQVTCFIYS